MGFQLTLNGLNASGLRPSRRRAEIVLIAIFDSTPQVVSMGLITAISPLHSRPAGGVRFDSSVMTASLKSTSLRSAELLNEDHRSLDQAGLMPLAPVLPRAPLHLVEAEGQLQVHTASYRGSFSSVFSQAMRAAGLGSRVLIAQFLKGGVHQGPAGCVRLCGGLVWLRPDVPACLSDPGVELAKEAVAVVWQSCRRHLLQGDLDQLVLDELGLAVALGYLDEQELIDALEQRPGSMDVIITGPAIPASVMSMADQVTELRRGF